MIEDAKNYRGITPAVFTFNGMCVACPDYTASHHLLGILYGIFLCASFKTRTMTTSAIIIAAITTAESAPLAIVWPLQTVQRLVRSLGRRERIFMREVTL